MGTEQQELDQSMKQIKNFSKNDFHIYNTSHNKGNTNIYNMVSKVV